MTLDYRRLKALIEEADELHFINYSAAKGDFCECGVENMENHEEAENHRMHAIARAAYDYANPAVEEAYRLGLGDGAASKRET